MKRIIVRVAIALLALAAVVVAIGWSLPVSHVAARTTTYRRAPQEVYAIVADVAAYPHWWDEVARVELLPRDTAGVRFRQHTSSGPVVMEVVEEAPPVRFVTRIDDPDQPFGGTWTFQIAPDAGGARLTITERGEVYNPVFRFLSRFVFGHTGTMESFLRALGARFGEASVLSGPRDAR